ncbi:site-specific integrase [Planktomarina temperata]|nr:site-specific integrase [Planktomarina temperata]
MLGKTEGEFEEKLLDGRALLFSRNGIFQVRLYKGTRQYIYKSLKTRDLNKARDLAVRAHYELEFRKEEQLPLQIKRFSDVLNEYAKLRESQNARGTYKHSNKANQQQTSDYMLRQIVRVSKFWHEYCGKKPVDKIDNALLRDYVDWRRDYYHRMPIDKRPKNHSLNPADKTLEWETTFALTVLKYAQERGYRGNKPTPTFRHKAQRTKTRPAFTLKEYSVLYKGIRRWMHEEKDNAKWRYTRELLRDYVLVLANSGMRVGEANNLRIGDLEKFTDERGRENYAFNVNGKTGKRYVILRASARRYVERTLERNAGWRDEWAKTAAVGAKQHSRKTAQHDDWLFRMPDGNKIITLIDQFNEVLKRENITHNADGEKYTLYSLRHFYAVQMLRHGKVNVFDIARNMGTSVQIIESYYGRHATAQELATRLGG